MTKFSSQKWQHNQSNQTFNKSNLTRRKPPKAKSTNTRKGIAYGKASHGKASLRKASYGKASYTKASYTKASHGKASHRKAWYMKK